MKFRNIITFIGFATLLLFSCNQDQLELAPKDKLTSSSTFSNYESIKIYAWQFYEAFPAYSESPLNLERDADLGALSQKNAESAWAWQKYVIPAASTDYSAPFQRIRAINLLLENLEIAKMSDVDKKHWRSVAYFFKAYNYADLVNKYGDITWVEKSLQDDDQVTLYGPRTPRDEVAKKILELLQYAEANIKTAGDGANTINTNVVRALISRFGLMEGTWRKYHGLADAATYLNACVAASDLLITAFPKILSSYGDVFNSATLAGKDGIILYKQYEKDQVTHTLSSRARQSAGRWDLTRKAIDLYLLKDGQTRWTSPLFAGDDTPYKEFRNRDTRMYFTTYPPYQVNAVGLTTSWTYTSNVADREYIDIMNALSPSGMQGFPARNWTGNVVRKVPHFDENNGGVAFSVTYTGYQFTKFSNRLNEGFQNVDFSDAPIFRIEEIMLNYAEAKKELGSFDQTVCDRTINKLRARGGVANMLLGNISNDPTRDPSVDQVLWEIRRERSVELMGEGYRFNDLRRWKKMDYATERKLGMWIVRADEANKVPTLNNAAAGYVSYEGIPPTPFLDYYYLFPIPSNQIVLTNGVVKQNPGWVK